MTSFQKAPVLTHNGLKDRNIMGWGFAKRPHELETAFAQLLAGKEFAMYKIMMFLSGNAPNKFKVAEKTIMERCNISESGYKKARKKLVDMGWISHAPSQYIQVNFNKIYSDYDNYRQGCSEKFPAPSEMVNSENGDKVFSKMEGVSSEQVNGFSQDTYNNISNTIINNNITNIADKGSRCEETCSAAASAAASQISSQPLRERYYSREELEKVEKEFIGWFNRKEREICDKYNGAQTVEDMNRMYESEEYKNFLKEVDEKRDALKSEYGKGLKIGGRR